MTTDPMTRLEQLQQELDEAQQIANNNYRLYTQVKEQRDELLEALKVAATWCSCGGSGRWVPTGPFFISQPCPHCSSVRAVIAKAEGR